MARTITVVGLGPGSPALLTQGAIQALTGPHPVILRTERHPVVPYLRSLGVRFSTCDGYYEQGATFEVVYGRIVDHLLTADHSLVYAVPGHPRVGEETVRLLAQRAPGAGVELAFAGGPSFLDAVIGAAAVDPVQGLEVLDALSLADRSPAGDLPAVVAQVYSRQVAADVKLALMEVYPDEHPVVVVRAAGIPGEEQLLTVPLYQLDHLPWVDYLTSVYIPPAFPRGHRRYPLDPLVDVMARLRSPSGCPWDREQDHRTLKPYLLEESHEVLEAIDSGDPNHLAEELGDVLLQVAFHAQIAAEGGHFTMRDVVRLITAKLVRRHPHVFGDVAVRGSADVTSNWEAIKAAEKGARPPSAVEGVTAALPALMRAFKVQQKAARVGFDWPDIQGPLAKVREELEEFERAYRAGDSEKMAAELGDLLFAVVNVARFAGADPEVALSATISRFIRRFRYMEEAARAVGRPLTELSLDEQNRYWEKAKQAETRAPSGNPAHWGRLEGGFSPETTE